MPEEEKQKEKENVAQAVTLNFRNYRPKDDGLKKYIMDPPSIRPLEKDLTQRIDGALEAHMEDSEDAVLAIAPKKPNWDLKRDVQKKLASLANKTDRAIMDLIRKKIAEESKASGDATAPPAAGAAKPDEADERAARDETSMSLAAQVAARRVEDIDDDE